MWFWWQRSIVRKLLLWLIDFHTTHSRYWHWWVRRLSVVLCAVCRVVSTQIEFIYWVRGVWESRTHPQRSFAVCQTKCEKYHKTFSCPSLRCLALSVRGAGECLFVSFSILAGNGCHSCCVSVLRVQPKFIYLRRIPFLLAVYTYQLIVRNFWRRKEKTVSLTALQRLQFAYNKKNGNNSIVKVRNKGHSLLCGCACVSVTESGDVDDEGRWG